MDQALDQYRRLENALQKELGVRPAQAIEGYMKDLKLNRVPNVISLPTPQQKTIVDISEVAYARNGDLHLAYWEAGSAKETLIYLWGFVSLQGLYAT